MGGRPCSTRPPGTRTRDCIQSISELSKMPSACPQAGPWGLHFAIIVFPSILWLWRLKPQKRNSTRSTPLAGATGRLGPAVLGVCPGPPGEEASSPPHSQPEALRQAGSCQLEQESSPNPEPGLSQTGKSRGMGRLGRPGVGEGEKGLPLSPSPLPAKSPHLLFPGASAEPRGGTQGFYPRKRKVPRS